MNALAKFQDKPSFKCTADADRLEREQELRDEQKWFGLLHPKTTNTAIYNQVHLFFLVYMLALLPVRAAFDITPSVDDVDFWLDIVMDLLICVDIFLNFSKFYYDKGQLVTDRRKITSLYLHSWFTIEVLSVLPINYMLIILQASGSTVNEAQSSRFLRFARFARFVRLLRLTKMTKFGSESSDLPVGRVGKGVR